MLNAHGTFLASPALLATQLAQWQASFPHMGVLVLLPEAEAAAIPELQLACRDLSVPLLGALFPAVITTRGFSHSGVVVMRFDVMPARFLLGGLAAGDTECGSKISNIIKSLMTNVEVDSSPVLFTIFDGMLPHIETMLTQMYCDLDEQVRYAGVNAGSETFQSVACLFDETQCIANGVLGLLLPAQAETFLEHSYIRSKAILSATSSTGNRVDTIAFRPAFDVYQEVVREEYGIELTHENFYDYAAHFPFGVKTVSDTLVRIPISFNADGSLFFIGEIPPLSLLVLLKAPALDQSRCVEKLATLLHPAADADAKQTLLTFYCAGRRMHFQADAQLELEQLRSQAQMPQLFGALSLGEIDTIQDIGMPRFHNAAIVCVR